MHSKPMAESVLALLREVTDEPIFLGNHVRWTLLRKDCAKPIVALSCLRIRTSKFCIRLFIFFVTSCRHSCLRRRTTEGFYQLPTWSQVVELEIPLDHHIYK